MHETPSGLSPTLVSLVHGQAQADRVGSLCLKEGMVDNGLDSGSGPWSGRCRFTPLRSKVRGWGEGTRYPRLPHTQGPVTSHVHAPTLTSHLPSSLPDLLRALG